MKKQLLLMNVLVGGLFVNSVGASVVDDMLIEFSNSGAGPFTVKSGEAFWQRNFTDATSGKQRSCTTCHGENLTKGGKHARTQKPIDALAPSVNSTRLTERKEIEKWLKRNCKWTLGRECTAQEKGDVLTFMRKQ